MYDKIVGLPWKSPTETNSSSLLGKQQLRSRERTEIRKRTKASSPERITAGERHDLPAPDRAAASGRTEEGKTAACGHSPAPSPELPMKASLSSASVWEAGSGALCPPPQGLCPKRRWRVESADGPDSENQRQRGAGKSR